MEPPSARRSAVQQSSVREDARRRWLHWARVSALLAAAAVCILARGAAARESSGTPVEAFFDALIRDIAAACPLASPADQAAFDRCRTALYGDSALRKSLAPVVLWGRPSPDGKRLRDTNATQFAPDVLAGLYLPMFMFTGEREIRFDAGERLYRGRAAALFRNALDPGQYPYPFWHDARKWADYQAANQLTFWIDPAKGRVVFMQLSAQGKPDPRLASAPYPRPAFDGRWLWTDAEGRSQPQPALFAGLMRADNPYLGRLDATFRDLAGALRQGTCHQCHTPDNYAGTKRLVLMQTPVHAAGEIKRILRAVREGDMPIDDIGLAAELDPTVKAALLRYGAAFDAAVDAAREWEAAAR